MASQTKEYGKTGSAVVQPKEGVDAPAKGRNFFSSIKEHPFMAEAILLIMVLIMAGGVLYWNDMQGKIYIEKAQVYAPIISISPNVPGTIDKFYVQEGDEVAEGQKLAVVGGQVMNAKTSGIIVWTLNAPGQFVSQQTPVIKMIDTREFRVVGRLQEDKGLKDVKPGQKVMFSADAFGSRQYWGVVESVGLTARQSDIVFSISDKRQEQEFEVRVLFDTSAYPELKNGMSAKMWVYQ